jgi:hypothetical protein
VASRGYPDRAEVQARTEEALAEANRTFAHSIAVPFTITLGDEWQGLLTSVAAALEADFHLRHRLHPLPIASGIGSGSLSTPVRERTPRMDGPCFHRSREALDRAKERKGSATVLQSGAPLSDEPINALCLLLHAVSERWTPRQFASLTAYLDYGTEVAAARSLGVTQPTLHQSLDRSRAKTYLEARDALFRFARNAPFAAATPEPQEEE